MHLYIALLCIAVHPKRFTIMWGGGGGGSPQPAPVCSIHLCLYTVSAGQSEEHRGNVHYLKNNMFLNIKSCQHILLHQIHKIMNFKMELYEHFKNLLKSAQM